jgi:dihydropteroate synthase
VLPVLRDAVTLGVPVSVDTSKAEVMRRASTWGWTSSTTCGAAGQGAVAVVAAHPGCGVCLMHMQGEPATMQAAHYDDVVDEVRDFLQPRRGRAAAGVAAERIVLDPGIGFGKTPEHNLACCAQQAPCWLWDRPLLVGWSRKSTLGAVTGRPVGRAAGGQRGRGAGGGAATVPTSFACTMWRPRWTR